MSHAVSRRTAWTLRVTVMRLVMRLPLQVKYFKVVFSGFSQCEFRKIEVYCILYDFSRPLPVSKFAGEFWRVAKVETLATHPTGGLPKSAPF